MLDIFSRREDSSWTAELMDGGGRGGRQPMPPLLDLVGFVHQLEV
jgi:hypothetical protein